VLVAKPGLDGHDRGAKVIGARTEGRGDGSDLHRASPNPEQIANAAVQEDVSVVCLSILSGAHMTLLPKVVDLLRKQEAGDILILAGGTIPAADIPGLKAAGIAEVLRPVPTRVT